MIVGECFGAIARPTLAHTVILPNDNVLSGTLVAVLAVSRQSRSTFADFSPLSNRPRCTLSALCYRIAIETLTPSIRTNSESAMPRRTRGRNNAALAVLPVRDRLHVLRVHASLVSAEMVNLKSVKNRPVDFFVGDAMHSYFSEEAIAVIVPRA